MTSQPHSLALVVAALVPALTVVWTVDRVTPVVVGLLIVTALTTWTNRTRLPWRRIGVTFILACGVSLVSLLYARPSGTVYVDWGFAHISDGSFEVGLATLLRVLAIGVPALLVFADVEPHEFLATTVVRRFVPQRVALATLIALRLAPVIAADLAETRTARRAAGLTTRFWSLAVTTLVIAIRRAIRMSEIAEVRGFSHPHRVWVAYRPFARSDWTLVAVAILSGGFALVLTALTGGWNGAI